MKNRLKTHQLILLATLISLVLVCGAVVAYMFMRDAGNTTLFIPAKVAVQATDETGEDDKIKTIILTNDKEGGGSNIDAYLRVRVVSYWVDGGGNVAPLPSPVPTIDYDDGKWVKGSNNTFYYKTPVAPGASTGNLLKSPIEWEAPMTGYKQEIDIFAEAIQAKPTTAAVSSWVVTVDDSTEEITAAP